MLVPVPPTVTNVLTPLQTPHAIPTIVLAGNAPVAVHTAFDAELANKYAALVLPFATAINLALVSVIVIAGVEVYPLPGSVIVILLTPWLLNTAVP